MLRSGGEKNFQHSIEREIVRHAAQKSTCIAITKSDVTASGRPVGAVIELIVGAAMVGVHIASVEPSAVILKSSRQRRQRIEAVGKLYDARLVGGGRKYLTDTRGDQDREPDRNQCDELHDLPRAGTSI